LIAITVIVFYNEGKRSMKRNIMGKIMLLYR